MIDNMLSLYIHIPFCKRKCYYCDFLSGPASEKEMENYMNNLIVDIKKEALNYRQYQIYSIFIGGGTPSLLPEIEIQRILDTIKENYQMQKRIKPAKGSVVKFIPIEITIEVNPGTIDKQKLEAYHKMGINRISIGLQSTNNKELQNLGRIHTYEEFLRTYQSAIQAGFTNINIDIMSAIPEQTLASYEDTVTKICQLQPTHISAYSLIIEEGTPFYQMYEDKNLESKGQLPDEEVERKMYQRTKEILDQFGYERYEISNYAKKGYECKHNEVYWKRGNYLGFGSAAASMVENIRWSNCGEEPHLLPKEEQMSEFMFLGLRRMKGISKDAFMKAFQVSIEDVYGEKINKLQQLGLIKEFQTENRVTLTEKGIDLSNYVFGEF